MKSIEPRSLPTKILINGGVGGPGRGSFSVGFAAGILLMFSLEALAVIAASDDPISFNRQIRPILAENCLACHGFDSASREAGLRLDDRDDAIEAGAIDLDSPTDSLLLERIFSDDADLVMPPPASKKSLSSEQKELMRKWLEQGALYERHWAFEPPLKALPAEPADKTWTKHPIDQFVLQQLELNQLQPAPPAPPELLFRRLNLDITGLLPTPADLKLFVADYERDQERAISEWIDRLMASSGWGEHRGRYWLDAARYADTHGMHFDNYREMWQYRDWVIRSFNANQPFDQFIREQIAGDLLPEPSTDQLIATGFQRCNITTNEGGTIEEENLALYAADRVQTFSWIFLGLTINCAQCHDHKFDPVTINDYYSLAAFFRNTTQTGLDGNSKDGRSSIIYLPAEQDQGRWKVLPTEIDQAQADLKAYRTDALRDFMAKLAAEPIESIEREVPANDLMLHVPFNDGAGEQAKSSRGTSLPGIGEIVWNPAGKFGSAAELHPKASFVIGEIGNWDFDQSFSFGGWVKPKDKNAYGAIFGRMDTSNRFRGWDLLQAGRRFNVHLIDSWSDNAIKVRTANEVVADDRWQHVFVTYDGSRRPEGIQIFVDGVAQTMATDNNSLQPNASFKTDTPTRVGQRRADSFWSGSIQELRMYDRQLTGQEIGQIVSHDELGLLLAMTPAERTPEKIESTFDALVATRDEGYRTRADRVANLQRELGEIRQRSPITHVQQERMDRQPETPILMRGEYDKPGDVVQAATPSALHPFHESWPRNRLGLAHWVTDPANPITARVSVNRFWQEIFGTGLVATPEDFGIMGSPPTHPELLDWLAVDFQENGWDLKRFYKQVLSSATYRQMAILTPEKLERDPQNHWFSRGPRFRMDGEMIRDTALQASGLLSAKMYGAGARPYQPENIWNVVGLPEGNTREYTPDQGENLYRRSLYTFWKRMAHPPNLEVLNAPSREVCVVKRERTNTPLQALVTLNDPIFIEAARNLAQKTLQSLKTIDADTVSAARTDQGFVTPNDGAESAEAGAETLALTKRPPLRWEPTQNEVGLKRAALAVLNRELLPAELELLNEHLNGYRQHYRNHSDDAISLLKVGESPRDNRLDPMEVAAWTMICQQLLNLDEAITK